MPTPDEAAPHKYVTTRMIAERAGVSCTTVSLALRGHPRITAETRARVQRVADELGYRPDPQIAKLMHRLRERHAAAFQSTIAALTDIGESAELRYLHEMISGARARAEMLGYAFTCMRLEGTQGKQRALERILRSRGVEGVLLLPMSRPRAVDELLDWASFSVIASTYGVVSPEFHRVVPNQFADMLMLCQALVRHGYRRLGLVIPMRHDLTVHHGFSAAVLWQNTFGATQSVAPLVYDSEYPSEVKRWFKRERPDAIIACSGRDCHYIAEMTGLTIPGEVGFAVTSHEGQPELAGVEERPGEIGKTAMDLLNAKIVTGERGIPGVSMAAMIAGCWIPGPSVSEPSRRPQRTNARGARVRRAMACRAPPPTTSGL